MERNRNLLGIAITFTVAYLALLLISGCKTKYVTVPEYHKEYISRTDSFFHTDTIREKEISISYFAVTYSFTLMKRRRRRSSVDFGMR